MKVRPFIRPAIVLAMVLALVLAAVAFTPATLAQQIQHALGLDPDTQPEGTLHSAPAQAGIQPDEDGYSGPAPGMAAPRGPNLDAPLVPPADAFDLSGQPDSADQPAAIDDWSGFYYVFTAGSSLHSADYTMRSDYQPGACIAALDSGEQFFTLHLDLPHGARIDYLRLFYYDAAASDGTANIRKYDAQGNNTEITTINSAGAGGFGTTLSAFSGAIVNNDDGGYVLNWWPRATGSSLQLCGLRVAYRLPR